MDESRLQNTLSNLLKLQFGKGDVIPGTISSLCFTKGKSLLTSPPQRLQRLCEAITAVTARFVSVTPNGTCPVLPGFFLPILQCVTREMLLFGKMLGKLPNEPVRPEHPVRPFYNYARMIMTRSDTPNCFEQRGIGLRTTVR